MFIFATSHPRGKPTLVLDLRGGTVEEYKSKKYMFCLKVATPRSVVLLAFQSRLEQSKWLERAGKVYTKLMSFLSRLTQPLCYTLRDQQSSCVLQIISKHPLEANLAGYSLERVPKYYFLNYNIVALNMAHNFMIVSLRTYSTIHSHPFPLSSVRSPLSRRMQPCLAIQEQSAG